MTLKNKERLIIFTKQNLDALKWNGKQSFYFARNFEALCIAVNKYSKTYYAHWSISVVGKEGRLKSIGNKKMLGGYHIPLGEIKEKLRANVDIWKAAARETGSTKETTVGDLARAFINDGMKALRIRTRGQRIKYKPKTVEGYKACLKSSLLCEGVLSSKEYVELFKKPIRYNGAFVEGALKDVPLSKVGRKDIDIFMHRMQDKPVAANNTLAALSVAFEWDFTRASTQLYKGSNNPCLRVVKYQVTKDKKFLDIEKVLEVRKYIENNLHKTNTLFTPHFLAYVNLLLENGERQSDFHGLYWKKPNNIDAAHAKGCTGWVDLENGTFSIIDSKNRKPATEELSLVTIKILKKLNEMRYESLSWCVKSEWIFPRAEAPELCISDSSYRWQRDRFMFKFGLATRTLLASKKTRKLYKYKCEYTLKHLRKTFVTHYGRKKGAVAAQTRMRHADLKTTQDHYFTEEPKSLRVDDVYSPREERSQHKMAAIKGGKNE